MTRDQRKIRLSLDVTTGFYDRLEKLAQRIEVESNASVICQALQLYEVVARRHLDGATFGVVHQDREESLAFFGLPFDDPELRPSNRKAPRARPDSRPTSPGLGSLVPIVPYDRSWTSNLTTLRMFSCSWGRWPLL